MRISSISAGDNHVVSKGLWGNPKYEDISEKACIRDRIIHPYYPFAGETKEHISMVVKKNSSAVELKSSSMSYGVKSLMTEQVVKVMEALPFTAKEFDKFLKNRLPIIKRRLIERFVFDKNLSIMKKI